MFFTKPIMTVEQHITNASRAMQFEPNDHKPKEVQRMCDTANAHANIASVMLLYSQVVGHTVKGVAEQIELLALKQEKENAAETPEMGYHRRTLSERIQAISKVTPPDSKAAESPTTPNDISRVAATKIPLVIIDESPFDESAPVEDLPTGTDAGGI